MRAILHTIGGQYHCVDYGKTVVNYTTERGLLRRARQLAASHAEYWDNWQGWHEPGVYILTPGEDYTPEDYQYYAAMDDNITDMRRVGKDWPHMTTSDGYGAPVMEAVA